MKNFLAAIILAFSSMLAFAGPVATATDRSGQTLVLWDEQKDCPAGALYAELIAPDAKSKMKACWQAVPEGLLVVLEDGRGAILNPMQFVEAK